MSVRFHEGQRELQDHFDTRRLADQLGGVASDTLAEPFVGFIHARDMFFIATADRDGSPACSYKGGDPGFVRVVDEHTLAFPVYDGNGMFLTVGNLAVNPLVELLFIDFESGSRLRVRGTATVDLHDPLVDSYAGAIGIVRVRASAVYPNCRRYVHEYHKVAASPFVPQPGHQAPVPDWKRDPWFEGSLPDGDPALDPSHPSAPAIPQF